MIRLHKPKAARTVIVEGLGMVGVISKGDGVWYFHGGAGSPISGVFESATKRGVLEMIENHVSEALDHLRSIEDDGAPDIPFADPVPPCGGCGLKLLHGFGDICLECGWNK